MVVLAELEYTALKSSGNALFKASKYQDAIDCYTQVIASFQNKRGVNHEEEVVSIYCQCLGNRALCAFRLSKFSDALEDCEVALQHDPKYGKAWFTRAKCLMKLAYYKEALRAFSYSKDVGVVDKDLDNYLVICKNNMSTQVKDYSSRTSMSDSLNDIDSGEGGKAVIRQDGEYSPSSARRVVKVAFSDGEIAGISASSKQLQSHPALSDDIERSSPLLVPTPDRQKVDIEALLAATYGPAGKVEMVDGSAWFVLSTDWFRRWQIFTSNEAIVDSEQASPGPIDNFPLLAQGEEFELASYNTCKLKMKEDIEEGSDFILLPEKAWEALHTWYGGGPPFPRLAVDDKVGIWPTKILSISSITQYSPVVKEQRTRVPGRLRTSSGDLGLSLQVVYNDCGLSKVSSKAGNSCFVCRKLALKNCSACSSVYYCSKACQSAHWGYHKEWCHQAKEFGELPFVEFQKKVAVGLRGQVGLRNLGNSCYLNSSLQCLSHIKPLSIYFTSNAHASEINEGSIFGTKGVLVREYASLMKDLWFESKSALFPKKFRSMLGRVQPDWAGPGQQDAHEVVDFLLDKLHEDLNRVLRKPYTEKVEGDGTNDAKISKEEWEKHSLRDDSAIKDLVGSQYRSQMECRTCGKISVSFEYQQTVSLGIPRENNRMVRIVVIPDFKSIRPDLPSATEFIIKLHRDESMTRVKSALYDMLPAETKKQTKDISLLELSKDDHSLVKDYNGNSGRFQISLLSDGASLVAYLFADAVKTPPQAASRSSSFLKAGYLISRIITPPSAVGEEGFVDLVGYPQELQLDLTWSCRKVRMLVWRYVSRFIEPDSAIKRAQKAAEAAGSKEKVAFLNLMVSILPIRIVTRNGNCKISAEEYPEPEDAHVEVNGTPYFVKSKRKFSAVSSYADSSNLGSVLPCDNETTLGDFVLGSKPAPYVFLSMDWIGSWLEVLSEDALTACLQHESASGDAAKVAARAGCSGLHRVDTNGRHHAIGDHLSLEKCLLSHSTEEHGQTWYCNRCKEMQDDAKKTLQFSSTHLPSVLVLTLKRFAHRDMSSVYGSRGVGHTEKLDGDVDFPLDGLDLSPYCHSPDGQDSWTTNDAIYDLFAVCNHYGRMGFGHYSAFARDWLLDGQLSKQWVAFDDDDVRLVNENNVKTNAAYILFYKRRNTM